MISGGLPGSGLREQQLYRKRKLKMSSLHSCLRSTATEARLRKRWIGFAFLVAAFVAQPVSAQFQDLIKNLPRSANAVMLMNMEKAKQSPLGVREGWKDNLEKAYADGLIRVPPQATRYVLAAQLDFATMQPTWESALMDLAVQPSMNSIAKMHSGAVDRIEGLESVSLPQGTYVVRLQDQTVGAVSPASRQFISRWLREIHSASAPALSPYLERAAGYSDNAGSEIIMALDLHGALSEVQIRKNLEEKEWLKGKGADVGQLAQLISGIQGVRLGIRVTDQLFGRLAIDFSANPSAALPYAKQLILESLAGAGMQIDDFSGWKEDAKGMEIGLQGSLSKPGLRALLSILQSPVPAAGVAEDKRQQGNNAQSSQQDMAAASQQHFKTVVGYLNDLKMKKREVQAFAQHAVFFDRYATKIEKLPILNVDKDLIEWSAFVAQQLRQASGIVRGTGIRTGAQQSSVSTSTPDVYAYGYVNGWYGSYGYAHYAPYADMKYEAAQKRIIRKEGQGSARLAEQEIKSQIIAATTDMRAKMTEKYKVEFEF
jgi:hypothetical protein